MIALAASCLALAVPAAAAEAGPADPSARMVDAINDVRKNRGLRPLREAPRLDSSATRYAKRLMRTNSFAHGSAYKTTGFRRAGEILALNRGVGLDPRPALRLWLKSPPHRALLLDSQFRYVGGGPALGRFNGAPQTTIWVVHFGQH